MKRRILVTGACGGIGTSIVKELSETGFNVIATDHPNVEISNEVEKYAELYMPIDLLELYKNQSLQEKLKEDVTRNNQTLYGIVHNAAIQKIAPIDKLSMDDWERTFKINLLSPILITKIFLSELKINKGSIIHISSIHSDLTKPNFACYSTSKAALSGITRAMSVELGKYIRINSIEPAAISTKMLEEGFFENPALRVKLEKSHPCKRIGTPLDISKAIIFLMDPTNSFINGCHLKIGGGIHNVLHDPGA